MTSPAPPRLTMRGVGKKFGATVALDSVDLTVLPGEVHALVGENGAGKSTLMKVLSGAHQPDRGTMSIDGVAYAPLTPLEARRLGVGMIYQELSLAPHLTVEENIVLGMEPRRFGFLDRKKIRSLAANALRNFDHPDLNPDSLVSTLPVGAQQLVEIARSLAVGCKILVFDEPTSSLTRRDVENLFSLIDRLKSDGISILYISHFLEEVQKIADRVTVMRDGAVVGTELLASLTTNTIVSMMVGREVSELYPRSHRDPGETVLEIKNLSGKKKPDAVSLQLRRGEVLGISGLVGAGRTELLRTIFGLDAVRSGEITIGIYAGPSSPLRRWEQGIGILSENRKEEGLALNLSIADNMTLTKLKKFGPWGTVFPAQQEKAAQRFIEMFDIRCRNGKQRVGDLSGGNQQKVALARLLQHNVDILLLDEPTRGIDVAAKAKIYQIIDDLAAGNPIKNIKPKAILMVSSYIPELLGVCDRIATMCKGRLGIIRERSAVSDADLMMEATGTGG